MTLDFLLASVHHILVFAIVASLAAELVLIRCVLDKPTLGRLAMFDGVLGGAAGLLLLVGILRLIYGLKAWEFYASSHAFWTKMALFIAIGLLSITPTRRFLRWRRASETAGFAVPAAELSRVRRILHIEALLLFLIPVVAAAMARGMG